MSEKIIMMFFLAVSIFAGCSKKEETPEVINVVNISNTLGRSEYPAIAADSRGYFYVVWQDETPDGKMSIYLTQRPPRGTWTKPAPILKLQTWYRQPDIAVDKENTLHVVGQYINPQGWYEILYTKRSLNGDWTEPEIIGMYGMACQPKIGVDDYGDVHVAWQELVGYWPIIYSKRSKDGSWSIPVEISKELGGAEDWICHHQIAIDASGYAHVVWTQFNTTDLMQELVYTTNAPGGTWSDPLKLYQDPLAEIGSSQQIAIDDNNAVHIVWQMREDIFYSFKEPNFQWMTPARVCSTEAISSSPSLVISDNTLHLIWNEYENMFCYTSKEIENNWEKPKEWLLSGARGGVIDIAVSSSNVGIVIQGHQEPNYDNEEVYFCEIPKN